MNKVKIVFVMLAMTAALKISAEPTEALDKADTPFPIGIEGIPEYGAEKTWETAQDFGLNLVLVWASWDGSVPYSYSWGSTPGRQDFDKHLARLKRSGYRVSVSDTTVHMDQKHVPVALDERPFDDPELISQWTRYIEGYLAKHGDAIDYFNLGNEIDLYFGGHMDEWPGYQVFFRHGVETIRRLCPDIKIGIVLKPDEWSLETFWRSLEPLCDFLAVTYYTPNSAFEKSPTAEGLVPGHPKYFPTQLERAFRYAGEKPVLLIEVGAATDPAIDASPELQSQFIEVLFDWLPKHEDRLLGMLWLTYQDWPRAEITKALDGHLSAMLLEMDPFMRFLCTLGLRYEDGSPKPGLATFRREMRAYRGRRL